MKPKINKTVTTKGGGNIVIPNKIISKEYPEGISKDSNAIIDLKSLGIPYVAITNVDEILDKRDIIIGIHETSSYYIVAGLTSSSTVNTGQFVSIRGDSAEVLQGYRVSGDALRSPYTLKKGDRLVFFGRQTYITSLKNMILKFVDDVKYETNIELD